MFNIFPITLKVYDVDAVLGKKMSKKNLLKDFEELDSAPGTSAMAKGVSFST